MRRYRLRFKHRFPDGTVVTTLPHRLSRDVAETIADELEALDGELRPVTIEIVPDP